MTAEERAEKLYSKMESRIQRVNDEYIKLVAAQIKKIGKLNPSSIKRLEQLRIYGANSRKVKKLLAEALEIDQKELQKILEEAVQEQYTSAEFQAFANDVPLQPFSDNYALQQYVEAVARQTAEEIANYSNTTSIDENYKEVISDAIDAVSRGVADYNSAIRSSMRKLGGDGLKVTKVTYESGYQRRMDSAVRQNILDGMRQVAQKANEMIGEEIGADGVELSAHPYSALDHEPVQGRQFSLEQFRLMQNGKKCQDVDGNEYEGFERPIGQWNCHHIASYIIIGISSRRYTDEQLRQWREANHAGCEIDGKHYTIYQASQLMRRLETKVRQQKDIANLAKQTGDDRLRRESQAKIRDIKKKYSEVAEAANLSERRDKMVVNSYKPLKTKNDQLLDNETERAILNVETPTEGQRLPNSITAATTQNKIQDYALNSNHPKGKHKAEVLNSVLGYHYENWNILSDKIYNSIQTSVVSKYERTKYGDRYAVPMRIYGEKKKSIVIKTVWQVDNGSNIPRLITITFDKRTIREEG